MATAVAVGVGFAMGEAGGAGGGVVAAGVDPVFFSNVPEKVRKSPVPTARAITGTTGNEDAFLPAEPEAGR